jgi:DNA-binding protein H-NS
MPTLEQIEAKMKKLQAQAESLIAKRMQSVMGDIRRLMEEHGLTLDDIAAHFDTSKKRPGRPAGAASKAASKRGSTTKSAKTAVKGTMPPKYINRKTGETWSGHARPPAWIKDAKDRTKFLIDGASVAADAEASGNAKPAGKRKAAIKKVAAKKVATKKSATAKKGSLQATVTAKKAAAVTKKPLPSKKASVSAAKKARGRKTTATKTVMGSPDVTPVSETVASQAVA